LQTLVILSKNFQMHKYCHFFNLIIYWRKLWAGKTFDQGFGSGSMLCGYFAEEKFWFLLSKSAGTKCSCCLLKMVFCVYDGVYW
jgi:hypothetical protein